MPHRNGFQACRELKGNADYARIPVVMVTSKNTESDKFWGKEQGADGYVVKPFTSEDLLGAVRKLVGKQKESGQKESGQKESGQKESGQKEIG
jgi:DNA-binding response OmpR family regulator